MGPPEDGRGTRGTFFTEAASVLPPGNRGSPGGGHPLLLVLVFLRSHRAS